jgi:sterol desaturase/sphingolipid hydroxylase (fatty acid hydroxylase superfamily)
MLAAQAILSAAGIPIDLAASCVVAEFFGYWLHRLLHSDKLPILSRGHLIHHFQIYGPRQPMRAENYKDATDNRFSVGNVGLEWLGPSAIILAFCWGIMAFFAVPKPYQAISLGTLVLWPVFTFSYLHDRMHLSDFWMTRNPVLKAWFLKARRLHDIHHHSLDDEGRMDANFGIGFYFFDRIFRTIAKRSRPFNWNGYNTATKRYGCAAEPVYVRSRSDAHVP